MGILADSIIEDSKHIFDTDQFGETVTYHPIVGADRSIVAIITRKPPALSPDSPQGIAPKLEVFIRKDATKGASAIQVGDAISCPTMEGGSDRRHSIAIIDNQDPAVWHLELR